MFALLYLLTQSVLVGSILRKQEHQCVKVGRGSYIMVEIVSVCILVDKLYALIWHDTYVCVRIIFIANTECTSGKYSSQTGASVCEGRT